MKNKKDFIVEPPCGAYIPKIAERGVGLSSVRLSQSCQDSFIPSEACIDQIKKHFAFFEQSVLPEVQKVATQTDEGWHGVLSHTSCVVFRGIDYALSLNEDPFPVIFACAFHDAARKCDEYNETHAKAAVPLALRGMKKFADKLTPAQQESILYAIEYHTIGRNAPDYISACLWDADRTRLSWIYGYQEDQFTTQRAKKIASSSPKDYLTYQARVLDRPENEDKEMILTLRAEQSKDI